MLFIGDLLPCSPASSLGSSSWMPAASSPSLLSPGSIIPTDDYTTTSSMWTPGTSSSEPPFGMEVYDEDQLLGKLLLQ